MRVLVVDDSLDNLELFSAALELWGHEGAPKTGRGPQAAGFDVHLLKPIDFEVVQTLLRKRPHPAPRSQRPAQ